VLALLLARPAAAEERPVLTVPSLVAPTMDGKVDDPAWKDAAKFALIRGKESHADCRMMRHGRQLYLGFETRFLPTTLGVRFHFTDPETRRRIAVLVTPFDLPRPPLGLWLERSGGAQPLDTTKCDIRMHSVAEEGRFSFELRLPLDALRIAKPRKEYKFDAELWDTGLRRPTAYYPILEDDAGARKGVALIDGVPDWGSDVEKEEQIPAHEGLALLHELARRSEERQGGDEVEAMLGIRDGRRDGEALAKLDAKLEALVGEYPDMASLRAQRTRVLSGLNRPADALASLQDMRKQYPFLDADRRHLLAEAQLMRESGRYDDALAHLEKHRERLKVTVDLERDLRMIRALKETWEAELAYREEDAKRDDLPRVSVRTNRGTFVIELFEDDAPNSVASFLTLVEKGYYDDTRFHWVQAGGAVYGGDPNSRDKDTFNDGYGDPGYLIEVEPSRRVNLPMTVALADLRSRPRTQGGNFTINITANPGSDTSVSVIGRIIEGEDVVKRLGYYDTLEKATVVRKRDHPYLVVKRP
jgi:cyclophilin family peptidyl-prolyl cis-trans isomerase